MGGGGGGKRGSLVGGIVTWRDKLTFKQSGDKSIHQFCNVKNSASFFELTRLDQQRINVCYLLLMQLHQKP